MSYDLACTVTGANGFVGRHLIDALLYQNEYSIRIFGIDLTDEQLPEEVSHHPSRKTSSVTYHTWDVTQPLRSDFLAVDAIYHFAGIADPKRYLDEPIKVMDLNLMGLKNILERIVLWDDHRPRIIYSSTSEVYGLNTDVPFDEDDPMMFGQAMRWCYALSKAVGEKYLQAYSLKHGIRHTTFRFFNFVGDDIDAPGAGRVLTSMVGDAINKGVIRVTEPGTQTRCFTHIDDGVVPLVDALAMKLENPNAWMLDYTINLGNDEEITMVGLAEIVATVLGSELMGVEIDIVPRKEMFGDSYDDVMRRKPNVDKAREVFGWSPKRHQSEFIPEIVRAIAREMNQ